MPLTGGAMINCHNFLNPQQVSLAYTSDSV